MKILIATDGSECADLAQEDLLRAGFPGDVEAIVFSVADVWRPPEGPSETNLPVELNEVAARARARAEEAVKKAKEIADSASAKLKNLFGSWNIQSEATANSPAWGIISRAEQWGADLIVVGSQGLSSFGKLIQGSVSQKVVTHAHCNVRIGRCAPQPDREQIRLIAGFDGSPGAAQAVEHIAMRKWPAGTQIRMVIILDPRLSTAAISYLPHAAHWIQEGYHDEEAWIRNIAEKASEKLKNAGLEVSISVVEGDPKLILLEFEQSWQADCIFVGARGLTRVERFLMGSVSEAVSSRAHCSVEVVHR